MNPEPGRRLILGFALFAALFFSRPGSVSAVPRARSAFRLPPADPLPNAGGKLPVVGPGRDPFRDHAARSLAHDRRRAGPGGHAPPPGNSAPLRSASDLFRNRRTRGEIRSGIGSDPRRRSRDREPHRQASQRDVLVSPPNADRGRKSINAASRRAIFVRPPG